MHGRVLLLYSRIKINFNGIIDLGNLEKEVQGKKSPKVYQTVG